MKYLAICLLLVTAFSCKKGGGAKSKTQLITQSSWKFDNAALDVDRNGTPDSPVPPGFLQSCDTDNTLTFKSDNTGVVDEGASKCDPTGPQTIAFTWAFKNGEQTITLSNVAFGGLNGDVTVKTLNDTQLELHKDINVLGTAVNVIVYFKH